MINNSADVTSHHKDDSNKRERTILISDTVYKIMCMADSKNLDPSAGAEKLANMYVALTGPIDFKKLDIERAKRKAKEFNLL
ncbi:MAG: hypothetical protein HQK49_20915 [Oligoflexia bacterium]|nr:hypothetical protein [Oligoflexia bacterium]